MNIGEAAKASSVSAKIIRHYEAVSLIPGPARTDVGYRVFTNREVHMLQFIRRARDLDISAKSIVQHLAVHCQRNERLG